MKDDELRSLLNAKSDSDEVHALRAVVELHKPEITVLGSSTDGSYKATVSVCLKCSAYYPCATIQEIIKALK